MNDTTPPRAGAPEKRVTLSEAHARRALQLAEWMAQQSRSSLARSQCEELALALRDQLVTADKRALWREAARRYRERRGRVA